MEIKGKVHCFFEQSATFRDEFRKLGYESFDYDIQNSFGKTDFQIDLFKEIENAYDGMDSVFDNITKDDLNIFDVQMNTWWCGWITIKTFVASDICTDSIDYAKACAQELLDKLREELL